MTLLCIHFLVVSLVLLWYRDVSSSFTVSWIMHDFHKQASGTSRDFLTSALSLMGQAIEARSTKASGTTGEKDYSPGHKGSAAL